MLKLAFISDIHFGDLARTNEFTIPGQTAKGETLGAVSLSESLVKILKENNVQYLFVGGDLTSRARPQEFYYCQEKIAWIAQEADIPPQNIIWGVGNHDVDWSISRLSDNYKTENEEIYDIAKETYRIIAAGVATSNLKTLPKLDNPGPVPLTGVVENDAFVVFVLNSAAYCTHDQEFAHGKLSIQQLDWFKEQALSYENDKRWKIVLMHHHPFNYTYHIPVVDISTLEEGSAFVDIAGELGINLVLHGHRHHPRAETAQKSGWKNPITFICAGSLTVNAEHRSNGDIPNIFHIIELTDEVGVLTLYNYEYSSGDGWKPLLNNKKETPLDAKMKLGKIVLDSEIDQIICDLGAFPETTRTLIWDNLDERLHYQEISKINKKLKELLSPTHDIYGTFPENVHLIKQGGDTCEA